MGFCFRDLLILYITLAIVDRFLYFELGYINRNKLVEVAAMLVATKYEEIYAPDSWTVSGNEDAGPCNLQPLTVCTGRSSSRLTRC